MAQYFQNAEVHMTKEVYYEMCEALGEEVNEEDVPFDIDDFPFLVQQCFQVYNLLTDNWDTMGGNYLGKDYALVFDLFQVYDVTESAEILLSIDFLQHMDNVRSKSVAEKIKAKTPPAR